MPNIDPRNPPNEMPGIVGAQCACKYLTRCRGER